MDLSGMQIVLRPSIHQTSALPKEAFCFEWFNITSYCLNLLKNSQIYNALEMWGFPVGKLGSTKFP